MMDFIWTAERIEELTQLWGEGHSASKIGRTMNGISRCAVLGKVRRLNLPKRTEPGPRIHVHYPAVRRLKVKKPDQPELSPEEPASLRIPPLHIKNGECRWISSDPAVDNSMCGHLTIPFKAYCPFHFARAIQPATHIRRESDAQ